MDASGLGFPHVKQGQTMYKDEIWYRKFEQAIEQRRDLFSDKQWTKFHMDYLLKVANRVRELSDSCQTCRGYQHTLTRLEEEVQELPGSKAQRQHQTTQLRQMLRHFVEEHQLAPPQFFLRRWTRYGVFAGFGVGVVAVLVVGQPVLFPVAILFTTASAALYGYTEDQKVARERRLV